MSMFLKLSWEAIERLPSSGCGPADHSLSAHSPDPSILNYFLWHLHYMVCGNYLQTIDVLKNNIRADISTIPH